jgi:hypothetical protein
MKKQMVKNVLGLTVTLSLLSIVSVWAREVKTEALVSVNEFFDGYTLSINANNVTLEKIIKELGEKYTIKVVIYEKAILSPSIRVSFKDLSIEQGIKKVIKAAGIKNHLIRYRNNDTNRSEVSALALLGNSGKEEGRAFTQEPMAIETEKEDTTYVYGDVPSEDTLREKIESFKARYEWEDVETRELADYLLKVMPDPAKGPGLDELIKALDRRMKEGDEDTVDEELLYQAIGETVPPHIEPFMMESIKNYSQKYTSGWETDSPERSPNQLYRDFMSANRSKHADY